MTLKHFPGCRYFTIIRAIIPVAVTVFCSICLTWLYGTLLTFEQIVLLEKKALFIEGLPLGISLPSQINLSELSVLHPLKCGAFFGLSLGPLVGILFVIAMIFTTRIIRSNRLLLPVSLGYSTFLWLSLGIEYFPLLSGVYSLLVGFVLLTAYRSTSVILLKLEEKVEQRLKQGVSGYREAGGRRQKIAALLSLSLFILLAAYPLIPLLKIVNLPGSADIFLAIRDRALLGTPLGKIVNNYYYEHSPYAAEVIKPLRGKSQFTILYLGKDAGSAVFFKRERKTLKYFVRFVDDKSKAKEFLSHGGVDLFFVDVDLVAGREFQQELASLDAYRPRNIVVLSGEKNRNLAVFKNAETRMVKPLTENKIRKAVNTISVSQDNVRGLRRLIAFSLGGGLPLTAIGYFFTLPVLFFIVFWSICGFFRKKISTNVGSFFMVLLIFLIGFLELKKMENYFEMRAISSELAETKLVGPNIKFLHHKDPEIRSLVTENLYQKTLKKADKSVAIQVASLLTDTDPRVRMYAASTLGNLKSSSLLPYLMKTVDDPQVNVRYKTVEAMGKIEGNRALAPIRETLSKERNWYVSLYALKALRESLGRGAR